MKNKLKLNKQYGLVSKVILQNKKISIKAKGLYVYLSARSGNKYTCNPTIWTICNDLGICESTFHKLKKELITAGIIKIVKTGTGINKRNNYNILKKSNKGYGMVYLDVLKNSNINLKSKAIYGLLASYAGASFIAYPLVKFICNILKICRSTYFKYAKTLKELNVVKTKQLHINGRYAYCNYYINGLEPTSEEIKSRYIYKSNKKATTTKKTNKGQVIKTDYTMYENIIKANIEYNSLQKLYENNDKANYWLENIISILVNSIYFENKDLVVNGATIQGARVSSVLNKLNFSSIKTVINNLIATNNKITNIRNYIKVTLYNAYFQGKQQQYNLTK